MIEWLTTSHFSFLEGVPEPAAYFQALSEFPHYRGFALGDRMGLYGLIEAQRGKDAHPDVFYAPGIRLHFDHADPLFIYPLHRAAYFRLNQFLSEWALEGMKVREKGLNPLPWRRFLAFLQSEERPLENHYVIVWVPGTFYPWPADFKDEKPRVLPHEMRKPEASFTLPPIKSGHFPLALLELSRLCLKGPTSALSLVWPLTFSPGIRELQDWISEASKKLAVPILASSMPIFLHKEDRALCNVMWSIRHKRPLKELGYYTQANGQRRLLKRNELNLHLRLWKERLKDAPFLNNPFERGYELSHRHAFSLHELQYQYPQERIPAGKTRTEYLRELSYAGLKWRYPNGAGPEVLKQIEHELRLIRELGYEDYFLTVYDVLQYARAQKILFQGRGSAANSVICYCLGITAINPIQMDLLFERFLSMERNEPPDIDVDFEHERREEVLQELYARYGRKRAAMVSTYIRFRGRMAIRECGKAFGLNERELQILGTEMGHEGFSRIRDNSTAPAGIRLDTKEWRSLLRLAKGLLQKPRHLGIHSSGFVLASEELSRLCILEPARKEMRSVIAWDKNDIEYLKWVKVDFLSLGMLTAIRKCFHLIDAQKIYPQALSLSNIPQECEKTFAMIRKADTVGTFQIESRAQMNMLPRLAPKTFYDIVVEVAIVRPGPLQGGMVHPYIRRRMGLEKVHYESPLLIPILKKTLGVPIFQEQVMKIAIAVAGFTPGEADEMRRIMAGAWKYEGKMQKIHDRLVAGICAKGLSRDFAERIYKQIEGFGVYGFPESHSASFAILSYISAWLKCHHPAEFLCALVNSQPMGFYSVRALVADAERHGVTVYPPNILRSREESTLIVHPQSDHKPAVRLGLGEIYGLPKKDIAKILELQERGLLNPERKPHPSLSDLKLFLPPKSLELLIKANACSELFTPTHSNDTQRGDGRQKLRPTETRPAQMWELWKIKNDNNEQLKNPDVDPYTLPQSEWTEWKSLVEDYSTMGLSTRATDHAQENEIFHPVLYFKRHFHPKAPSGKAWSDSAKISQLKNGARTEVIGLMSQRQKPPTAKGLCFITLEDENGFLNLVLMPDVYEKFRTAATTGGVLAAQVKVQKSLPGIQDEPDNCAVSLLVEKLWSLDAKKEISVNPADLT